VGRERLFLLHPTPQAVKTGALRLLPRLGFKVTGGTPDHSLMRALGRFLKRHNLLARPKSPFLRRTSSSLISPSAPLQATPRSRREAKLGVWEWSNVWGSQDGIYRSHGASSIICEPRPRNPCGRAGRHIPSLPADPGGVAACAEKVYQLWGVAFKPKMLAGRFASCAHQGQVTASASQARLNACCPVGKTQGCGTTATMAKRVADKTRDLDSEVLKGCGPAFSVSIFIC